MLKVDTFINLTVFHALIIKCWSKTKQEKNPSSSDFRHVFSENTLLQIQFRLSVLFNAGLLIVPVRSGTGSVVRHCA